MKDSETQKVSFEIQPIKNKHKKTLQAIIIKINNNKKKIQIHDASNLESASERDLSVWFFSGTVGWLQLDSLVFNLWLPMALRKREDIFEPYLDLKNKYFVRCISNSLFLVLDTGTLPKMVCLCFIGENSHYQMMCLL